MVVIFADGLKVLIEKALNLAIINIRHFFCNRKLAIRINEVIEVKNGEYLHKT